MTATTPETTVVISALIDHLVSKNLIRWNNSGVYGADNPALPAGRVGILPPDPNTCVSINVYDWITDRDDHNPDLYVQLRFRAAGADLRAVERLADAVFAELHWSDTHLTEVWPGGVNILQSRRVVRGTSAPDTMNRYERPDSYRITFNPGD